MGRVVSGFLFGLGFSIATVGVLLVAAKITERLTGLGREESRIWRKRFTPEAKLVVDSHESRQTKFNLIVLGTVRNDGADSWEFVRLQVRLLDAQRHVVEICRGHVDGAVRPRQVRHFSVDCNGSASEPTPEHSTYEIEIVDASYEMKDD